MSTYVKCPNCGERTALKDNPFRPFCSERCKTIDLGAWADDKYSLPGEEIETDKSEELTPDKTYH